MGQSDPNVVLVTAFCESWASGDPEHVLSFLADDAEWENVPTGSLHGKAAIRDKLESVFQAADKIEWFVLHTSSAAGGYVLTERLDRIAVNGRLIDLRLMGMFLVVDQRIRIWRDYFDLDSYRKAMGPPAW